VVDEEAASDGGAGMDLDAGQEARQLRNEPGGKPRGRILPQLVRQAVRPDGMQSGVGEKILKRTSSRRVMGPGGVEVFLKSCEETHKDLSTGNGKLLAKA
jgi:hypothetical protein